jgi:hypothetical protein
LALSRCLRLRNQFNHVLVLAIRCVRPGISFWSCLGAQLFIASCHDSLLHAVHLPMQVVQVYTYMLTPLMAGQDKQQGGQQQQQLHKQLCGSEVEQQLAAGAAGQQLQQEQWEGSGKGDKGQVSGWSLRLVMEYCDQVSWRVPHQFRGVVLASNTIAL